MSFGVNDCKYLVKFVDAHRYEYLFLCLQGLTIIAFNKGNIDAKTIREVLSLGPTFVVMKFLESKSLCCHVLLRILFLCSAF